MSMDNIKEISSFSLKNAPSDKWTSVMILSPQDMEAYTDLRAWCETIDTCYIKYGGYNSFALSTRMDSSTAVNQDKL